MWGEGVGSMRAGERCTYPPVVTESLLEELAGGDGSGLSV